MDKLLSILPLVGIALLFWFLLVRPAQRRQRELGRMQGEVSVGDEVMLTSGIYGSVREIDKDTVWLDVADGVTLKVARGAIGATVTTGSGSPGSRDDEGLVTDEPEEK